MKKLLALLGIASTACSAQAALIYSQMPASPPSGGFPSQMWVDPTGQNDSTSDCAASDDFTLSKDTTITHIEWWGDAAPSLGFTISFYNQDTNTTALQADLTPIHGHPPLSSQIVTTFTQTLVANGQYFFTLDLPVPVALKANSTNGIPQYFLSIVGNTPGYWDLWNWAQSPGAGQMFYYQYHASPAGGPWYTYRPDRAFTLSDASPTPPVMKVARAANAVSITWPTNAAGFRLQEKHSISATNWVDSTNTVNIATTNCQVNASLPATNCFYRLFHP